MSLKKIILKFLPFDKMKMRVKAPKEKVLKNIKDSFDVGMGFKSETFGKVKEDGFRIGTKGWGWTGAGRWRNSFVPVAIGRVKEEDDGFTVVDVFFRMYLFSSLLGAPFSIAGFGMLVAFPIVTAVEIIKAVNGLIAFSQINIELLFALIAFPIFELAFLLAFKIPCKKMKKRMEMIILACEE